MLQVLYPETFFMSSNFGTSAFGICCVSAVQDDVSARYPFQTLENCIYTRYRSDHTVFNYIDFFPLPLLSCWVLYKLSVKEGKWKKTTVLPAIILLSDNLKNITKKEDEKNFK